MLVGFKQSGPNHVYEDYFGYFVENGLKMKDNQEALVTEVEISQAFHLAKLADHKNTASNFTFHLFELRTLLLA